jgi:integrase
MYLARRYEAIENPFRGTRVRTAMERVKELKVPTRKEVETIIKKLDKYDSSAVGIMAYRGLRAGALPTLEKKGGRYYGSSKGKALEENGIKGIELPEQCIELMKEAELDEKYPYKGIKSNTLECRIRGGIKKLYKAGEVSYIYSCHDFRHYYAKEEYEKTKDIYRVSKKLLSHTSVTITEGYLRSLEVRI